MIIQMSDRKAKLRAQYGTGKLCYQLFGGISSTAKTVLEITIQARLMA